MMLRYAHLAPGHKLKAVEVFDRKVPLAAVAGHGLAICSHI